MPLRVFPVAETPSGTIRFADDFGDPRSGDRSHKGNDILAAEGTPLLAVDDGVASFGTDPLGGNVVALRAPDGALYYYAHLATFVNASVGDRRDVRAGDVLGTVGRTGNASGPGIPPHVHFEVRPAGGAPIDPYPLLRRAERRGAPGGRGALALLALAGLAAGGYWYVRSRPELARGLARRLSLRTAAGA